MNALLRGIGVVLVAVTLAGCAGGGSGEGASLTSDERPASTEEGSASTVDDGTTTTDGTGVDERSGDAPHDGTGEFDCEKIQIAMDDGGLPSEVLRIVADDPTVPEEVRAAATHASEAFAALEEEHLEIFYMDEDDANALPPERLATYQAAVDDFLESAGEDLDLLDTWFDTVCPGQSMSAQTT